MGCNSSKQQLTNHERLQENLVKDEQRKAEQAYEIEQSVLATGTSTQIRRGQSKAYKYTKTRRSKSVAIKLYDGKSTLPVDLKEEANLLSACDHPNVVKLYEVAKTNKQTSLVLELCDGGTLQDNLPFKKEEKVVSIMRQIVSAIAYLHHNGIVHRDIELSNIMFEDKSPDASIKLIDFGCATKLERPKDRPGAFKYLQEKTGSIHTMAPEVIEGRYGPKCDVWSIGVVAYMLLNDGEKPFKGNSVAEYENMITKSRIPFGKWKHSDESQKFIMECTTTSPVSRLSAAQALQHPWLQNNSNKKKYIPNELAVSLALFQRASPLKRVALNVLAMKHSGSKYREVFQRLDLGHTGYLTKEEFITGFAQSGLSKEELEDAYYKLDVNCNDRIMYTEFLATTMEVEGELDDAQLREAFDLLDTDHSGYISKKNLVKILGDSPAIKKVVASMLQGHEEVSFDAFQKLFQRGHSLRREIGMIRETNSDLSADISVPSSSFENGEHRMPSRVSSGQLERVVE